MSMMMYCPICKEYTLKKICPQCGQPTITPHPPRFSPQDRYGEYRRKIKKQQKGD